ncbi:MAG: helix-turn-helix domain-containing protein [Solirubrobacteraceae bacterium]
MRTLAADSWSGNTNAELLTPRQVSELAQMSYHAVLRAINDGQLAASRLRGRLRVRRIDFDAWVEESRVTPVAAARVPPADAAPLRRASRSPHRRAGSFDLLSAIEAEAS